MHMTEVSKRHFAMAGNIACASCESKGHIQKVG